MSLLDTLRQGIIAPPGKRKRTKKEAKKRIRSIPTPPPRLVPPILRPAVVAGPRLAEVFVDVDPFGPLGSGAPSELGFLRASDYNRIIDISKNKYGFDPGGIGGALDSYDNKFLARFDVEADENNSLS